MKHDLLRPLKPGEEDKRAGTIVGHCHVCGAGGVSRHEECPGRRDVVVDHVTLVCKGCGGEREFPLEVALHGAQELVEWMKTKPGPCSCGAKTCNVMAHLKDATRLS